MANSEKLGYTFYPKDWTYSDKIFTLTLSQRAVFRELIDLAMMRDNSIQINIETWARKWNTKSEILSEILSELEAKFLIVISENIINVPSCEKRLVNKRNGSKPKSNKPNESESISESESETANNRKRKEKEKKVKGDYLEFEEFWNMYDKKVDRTKCEVKFSKLNPTELISIKYHLPHYVKAAPEKQYRKNPLTYLNGKTFMDDPKDLKQNSKPAGTQHF